MTVGKKLNGASLCMLLSAVSFAASMLYFVNQFHTKISNLSSVAGQKLLITGELRGDLGNMRAAQRGIVLYALLKDAEAFNLNETHFHESLGEVRKDLASLNPLIETERGRELSRDISEQLTAWESGKLRLDELLKSSKVEEQAGVLKQVRVFADRSEKDASELMLQQKKLMMDSSAAAQEQATTASSMAWALLVIALCAGAVLGYVVRDTTRGLVEVTRHLAEGSQQIASASTQISSSSQTLAHNASQQAASLEETSASSNEISTISRQNADNSQKVAEVMRQVSNEVQEGNLRINEMVTSMHEINTASDRISKIIRVIDEIAFQTNILALNAAVEAARAGEAGMGFAVVAEEVRNLAQRSAVAAKDTAVMIEETISSSSDGTAKLEQVSQVMKAITSSSASVQTLVDEVSSASREQAQGIDRILTALTQMEQITQTTAANAEESASTSEELSAQAQSVNAVVLELRKLVGVHI